MAVLYIAEYAHSDSEYQSNAQVARAPAESEQTVVIGAGSLSSVAFGLNTSIIRVHADAICSVNVGGLAPTATTSNARMQAGQTEYWRVKPGDKIAVISNT